MYMPNDLWEYFTVLFNLLFYSTVANITDQCDWHYVGPEKLTLPKAFKVKEASPLNLDECKHACRQTSDFLCAAINHDKETGACEMLESYLGQKQKGEKPLNNIYSNYKKGHHYRVPGNGKKLTINNVLVLIFSMCWRCLELLLKINSFAIIQSWEWVTMISSDMSHNLSHDWYCTVFYCIAFPHIESNDIDYYFLSNTFE